MITGKEVFMFSSSLLKNFKGKNVFAYSGDYLGKVAQLSNDELTVEKKFLGLDLLKKTAKVFANQIDYVSENAIHLHPSHAEYWQLPELENEIKNRRFLPI